MVSIVNRKTLGMLVFSSIAAFFAFPGISMAQYVPKAGENAQFVFTASGQTADVGSGYVFTPILWGCDDGAANGIWSLSDIFGTVVSFPIYTSAVNREGFTIEHDAFLLKWTLTFTQDTAADCFFMGKKVLETSWNAYADASNSGAVTTVTTNLSGSTVNVSTGTGRTAEEWFTEVSNSDNAPAFLLWLALTVFTYLVLPVWAFVIGWKYGAHFFTSSKNGG